VFVNGSVPSAPVPDEEFVVRHVHKRATVDPKKTTCMLYLQADHLFYQKYGTEEACIEVMTRHVQRVNSIYKATGILHCYFISNLLYLDTTQQFAQTLHLLILLLKNIMLMYTCLAAQLSKST
jgi:uncharacterized membrane protein